MACAVGDGRARFVMAFRKDRDVLECAVLTVLPGAVAFAAAMDLLTMKIPNRITAVWCWRSSRWHCCRGSVPGTSLNHVAAGLLMLVLGVLLFIPGWFGGGDAKLMAAIGLWIGADNLARLHALCRAGRRLDRHGLHLGTLGAAAALLLGEAWALRLHRHDAGIPYGLALAAGALLVYPQTVWFAGLAR